MHTVGKKFQLYYPSVFNYTIFYYITCQLCGSSTNMQIEKFMNFRVPSLKNKTTNNQKPPKNQKNNKIFFKNQQKKQNQKAPRKPTDAS